MPALAGLDLRGLGEGGSEAFAPVALTLLGVEVHDEVPVLDEYPQPGCLLPVAHDVRQVRDWSLAVGVVLPLPNWSLLAADQRQDDEPLIEPPPRLASELLGDGR